MSETSNDITSGLTKDITNIIDSSKKNLGSLFNADSNENITIKTSEIFDILTKTKEHIINLNDDLTTIYSAILNLKSSCKGSEDDFANKNKEFEKTIKEVNDEKDNIKLEMDQLIASNTLSVDELHNKLVIIQSEQDKLNLDNAKIISELQSEILRCAKEKGEIFNELSEIDDQVKNQIVGPNSFYSKVADALKLPQKGGFNWRTAAESKKLMSSKSSNKFLREKDNHSKKLQKRSRTSQNMKSKKKKKGIFRNLGLFRKNKK